MLLNSCRCHRISLQIQSKVQYTLLLYSNVQYTLLLYSKVQYTLLLYSKVQAVPGESPCCGVMNCHPNHCVTHLLCEVCVPDDVEGHCSQLSEHL